MNTADLKLYTRFFTDLHPALFAPSNIEIEADTHAMLPILFLTARNKESGKAVRYAVCQNKLKEVKKDIANGDYDFLRYTSEFSNQGYKYHGVEIESPYKYVVSHIPIIAPLKSYKSEDRAFSSLLNGDFGDIDHSLTTYSKKQSALLVKLVTVIREWGETTTVIKDHDLYFSFLEEDHKITFCLDKAPAISPEGVDVDRTPINEEIESQFPEAERIAFIGELKTIIDEINKNTEEYFANPCKHSTLTEFRENLWDTSFAMPIQYQVSKVYEFKEDCDATKAMVTGEVDRILSLMEQKSAELGTQVYLDTTAVLPFYKDEEGTSHILSGDDDFMRPIWGSYIESFGKAVARALVTSDSVYFKPFVGGKSIVDPTAEVDAERTLVVNDPHVTGEDTEVSESEEVSDQSEGTSENS